MIEIKTTGEHKKSLTLKAQTRDTKERERERLRKSGKSGKAGQEQELWWQRRQHSNDFT